jgi:hypothetical protein
MARCGWGTERNESGHMAVRVHLVVDWHKADPVPHRPKADSDQSSLFLMKFTPRTWISC